MSDQLINAIADMDEEGALALTKELLAGGTPPAAILEACRAAMEVVGSRFESGECFIPELILAGEMLKGVSAEVKPYMTGAAGGRQEGRQGRRRHGQGRHPRHRQGHRGLHAGHQRL